MYSLFLVLAVAAVILSPLALELWLTTNEKRAQRRHANQLRRANTPGISWASSRLQL